jgi:hypothetical protein
MRSDSTPGNADAGPKIGDALDGVDTPALIVELDAPERNVATMAAAVEGRGVRLRPHAKSHKCPDIARRQIAAGAVGICCQKVGEAEIFVKAGIRDVLITNEIVGAAKLARLAALARSASIGVLVDDPPTCMRWLRPRKRREHRSTCWWKSTWARIAAAFFPVFRHSILFASSPANPGFASPGCRPIRVPRSICGARPSGARPSHARRSSHSRPGR